MSAIECALLGALGRDGEARTSKAGRQYLRLSVRVGDGDEAQWVSVLAFDHDAVERADGFERGARVYIEGTLHTSEWTGQDGRQRFGLSCMSWHCRLSDIGRTKRRSSRKPKPSPAPAATFFDDSIPF